MPSVKPKTKNIVEKKKAVKKESVYPERNRGAGLGLGKISSQSRATSSSPRFAGEAGQPPFKGGNDSPPSGGVRGDVKRNLELPVYNTDGAEVEKIKLPTDIFGLKINNDLVKQALEAQMSQARAHYAHTKDRGEVSGGGKKPWRQKGTGRARHGSTRSPIWRHGGVTFGPRNEKNFAKKINKKMRRAALFMVLSGKARDNEIIILDNLKLEQPKTKLMAGMIKKFHPAGGHPKGEKVDLDKGALIILAQKNENVIRASRNIKKLGTIGAASLNLADLLNYKYLLMPKEAIEIINKTYKTNRTE